MIDTESYLKNKKLQFSKITQPETMIHINTDNNYELLEQYKDTKGIFIFTDKNSQCLYISYAAKGEQGNIKDGIIRNFTLKNTGGSFVNKLKLKSLQDLRNFLIKNNVSILVIKLEELKKIQDSEEDVKKYLNNLKLDFQKDLDCKYCL